MKNKICLLTIVFILIISSSIFSLSDKLKINADIFELDGKKNTVIASGNVVVVQQDVTITGAHATYNQAKSNIIIFDNVCIKKGKMQVFCDQVKANNNKGLITALGNVRFTIAAIKGQANKAVYNINTKKIILTGKPTAQKNNNKLTGDLITIDLKTEKIVTRGSAKIIFTEGSLSK